MQQTDNNLGSLRKKTLLESMRKFNQRVQKKVTEMRDDNMELHEQRRRVDEAFDSGAYLEGLGAEQIVQLQFILNVISYYQTINDQLHDLINLKYQVNDNSAKIAVMHALLGQHSERHSPVPKKNPFSESFVDSNPQSKFKPSEDNATKAPAEISTGASAQLPSLAELEAQLEAAEAEKTRLTNSVTTIQSRNKTLGNELTKNLEIIRLKKAEDLEKKIEEQRADIEDIKQEIELLSS